MSNKQKETEMEKQARSAIGFLEHLRVEHGCEATLQILVRSGYLAAAVHKAVHGEETNESDASKLRLELQKVAAASPLDKAAVLGEFWNVIWDLAVEVLVEGVAETAAA